MVKVNDIRWQIATKHEYNNHVTDKSGCKMLEIINAAFTADEDYIFRKPNEDYIKRELEWYKSQSLMVQDIPGETPKIWKEVSSNLGVINSNYGFLIWSEQNWSQYENVRTELQENTESRRANMIYTRPAIWEDYYIDDMNDFICTNNVQYFIRDNKLITSVYMRSNDAVFGYNNDFAWQKYVRDKLIDDLEVDTYHRYEPGPIFWNVGSFHVYERHFDHVEKWMKENFLEASKPEWFEQ